MAILVASFKKWAAEPICITKQKVVRQQMFKRIQQPMELYLLETAFMEYSI